MDYCLKLGENYVLVPSFKKNGCLGVAIQLKVVKEKIFLPRCSKRVACLKYFTNQFRLLNIPIFFFFLVVLYFLFYKFTHC